MFVERKNYVDDVLVVEDGVAMRHLLEKECDEVNVLFGRVPPLGVRT